MAKRLPEIYQKGVGDLTAFMHDKGSIADLSWLAVDVEEYRRLEALPEQNLDVIPELVSALTQEKDSSVPSLIPLKPHTVVNSNPLSDHNNVSLRPTALTAVRNKMASYMMSGMSDVDIASRLKLEFSSEDLRCASKHAHEVMRERGLLGNVYVDAAHFPRCAQKGDHREFVKRYAKRALYVLAKSDCTGCVHNHGGRCAVFNKRIKDTIPYNSDTLAHYAVELCNEGRLSGDEIPDSMTGESVRKALKTAFLRSPIVSREKPAQTIQYRPKAEPIPVSSSDYEDFFRRKSAKSDPMPSPSFMMAARMLMSGKNDIKLVAAAPSVEVRKLAQEFGLIGHTYLDADALGGCAKTLKFMKERRLSPDFVVLRASDTDHHYAGLSKLTKIVASIPDIGEREFKNACERALRDNRLTSDDVKYIESKVGPNSDWRKLTAGINLFKPKPRASVANVPAAPKATFYYGRVSGDHVPVKMDPEEVRCSISHMMNTGLYGKRLRQAVLSRYSRADLAQVPEVGRDLAVKDGAQGSFFIDPTAYPDYGRGCVAGSKQFRSNDVKYVMASSACTGCVHQTAPGWCIKYAKSMIRKVPDEVIREAAERRKPKLKCSSAAIENPVEKYGITAEITIDPNGARFSSVDVELPTRKID